MSIFQNCTLKTLYLYAKSATYSNTFNGLNVNTVIFAYRSELSKIKRQWDGVVGDIEQPYSPSTSRTNFGSVAFSIITNEIIPATLQGLKFRDTELMPDEDGIYTISGLEPGTEYDILIMYKTLDGEVKSYTQTIETKSPNVKATQFHATQTTITLTVDAETDTTCLPIGEMGVYSYGTYYYCTDGKVTVTGLIPGESYSVYPFAIYGTKRIEGTYERYSTASMRPEIITQEVGPTSISVKGSYTVDDAHVSETGFTDHGTGNTLTLTGLSPNTSYTVSYYVRTEEGSDENVSKTFTTSPEIKLTTLQPKCVSSTCAIVAAETNISEEETGVGFQWKKYDAPESLKPSEGYAAIYNGQLEGYIRNLQPTSYYNVRAFYKSAEGNYYYGDWVTFDPSDFSYFEPTVHTYEATEIGSRSAKVKGYVLAGTDDIIEQGFEYWPTGSAECKAIRVKATAENNVSIVFGTGQVMTATLTDLLPSSTYCFRSFVKTASGTTNGEEQTFTTDASTTGIGNVETDVSSPVVVGYYDLSGRKHCEPQKGMNIVRYSDGSVRKVLIR